METVEAETTKQNLPFQFSGTGLEYFKIWIVNICLSVLTLGIYSAWAKVRTNSYFYGNTILDNSHFSYLADPKNILKGRIISVILFGIYWGAWQFFPQAGIGFLALGCLLFPFFIVSAMSFRMRNSAYRNIRFHFVKDLRAAYMVFLLPLALVIFVTWLLYTVADSYGVFERIVTAAEEGGEVFKKEDLLPTVFFLCLLPVLPWLDFLRTRFIINHTQYGKSKASFNIGAWGFFKVYILTFLAFVGVFVLLMLIVGGAAALFHTDGEQDMSGMFNMFPVLIVVLFYSIGFFISGLWKAMRGNMINNNTMIGENQLHSHLKGLKIGWIYLTNTIAIVFSMGMLIPWAKVRMARYVASCTELHVEDLGSIRSIEQDESNAFGEEMGEVFDMELGF